MRVLFVCTGNVFRSMIAEKCLKDYFLKKNMHAYEADSAGIAPSPQMVLPWVTERLMHYDIAPDGHRWKKVTSELCESSDLVIAMNRNHQEHMRNNCGIESRLFNTVAYGKPEGVLDFNEVYQNTEYLTKEQVRSYAFWMVDYLHEAIPRFAENMRRYTGQMPRVLIDTTTFK